MSRLSIREEINPTLFIQYGSEGTHPWKLKSQHFNSTVIVSSPIHCAGVQSQHNTERTSAPLPSSPASLTSSSPCFCLSFLFHYAFRQLSSPSTSSSPPLLSYPPLSLSSCRGAVTCLRKPNRTLRSYLTASCYACVCVCACMCVCVCEERDYWWCVQWGMSVHNLLLPTSHFRSCGIIYTVHTQIQCV